MPKCQIQWVDDNGRPTPDQNEAVCVAVHEVRKHRLASGAAQEAAVRRFACCAAHAVELQQLVALGWQEPSHTQRWLREELP